MGKQITKKFGTMELNKRDFRSNKSYKKKEQTKHKMQACKRIIQACKDLKVEIPEKILHIQKCLGNTYNKIYQTEFNRGHFLSNLKKHTRKNKKENLMSDIVLK